MVSVYHGCTEYRKLLGAQMSKEGSQDLEGIQGNTLRMRMSKEKDGDREYWPPSPPTPMHIKNTQRSNLCHHRHFVQSFSKYSQRKYGSALPLLLAPV